MFEDAPRADPGKAPRKTTSPAAPITRGTPETLATLLHIKVVPGSRTDAIVGPRGNRLKLTVAAPP